MGKTNYQESRDDTIEKIAVDVLHVETLADRKSDSLDFYDCSVWGIKAALEQAYEAGRRAGGGQ